MAALLGPYQARLKEELERHGGTVEKFIGDAVMAIFGAPTAHEDDPERAVRAALAIRDFAREGGIELRIGITTGEALVSLDARPDAGETLAAGDVVNTASRLQAAAPVNSIFVSDKTYQATKQAIEYRQAESVKAKGKARPIPVWEAVQAPPPYERTHVTPFVGRERELEQLRAALARARDERTAQLVTLVGEPGIGKSRLVHELSQNGGGLAWRRGRCLPYGEGVTFWALGEIVKAELGILESDSLEKAQEKLQAAVADPWVAGNLRPLVGLGESRESLGDRRAEAFAAWRRFLGMLAEEHPLALVLEDLHWADDSLLDFVSDLFEWAQESPLLLLCTARPELLERRPGWGSTDRGLAIALDPLSEEETGRLLSALVGGDAPGELVARAAGNPLYAEQYARLAVERGSLEELPTTVQGIIAARLDDLPGGQKALVQDAAVLGRVFWAGAVAALAGSDRWSVEERLLALERRELVRREHHSSVEGETQYSFTHVLLRDVAYNQIPRTERADKHRLAAHWIEALGRPEDHAEMLAHHYLGALELARAADRPTEGLAERAREALQQAGGRAFALNAYEPATHFFEAAFDLFPEDSLERARLLFEIGRARYIGEGRGAEQLSGAAEALAAFRDSEAAAEAEVLLGDLIYRQGDRDGAEEHLQRALALVWDIGPSRAKASVLTNVARHHIIAGRDAGSLARKALQMAEQLGLDDLRAHALNAVGLARGYAGDPGVLIDLEKSARIAAEAHVPHEQCRALNNLYGHLALFGHLTRSAEVYAEAVRVAEQFGQATWIRWLLPGAVWLGYLRGNWDRAMRVATEFLDEVEAGSPHYGAAEVYPFRGLIRLGRDDEDAVSDADRALALIRATKDPQTVYPALAACARIFAEAGSRERAAPLVDEFVGALTIGLSPGYVAIELPTLAFAALELELGDRLVRVLPIESPIHWVGAARAFASRDFERAADLLAEIGSLPDEAYARLRAGQEGNRQQLERALAFYHSVGATRYIREGEALLASARQGEHSP